MMAKTKMSVPKYLAGVFVVQPEKRRVTSVDVENVVLMPIGVFIDIPVCAAAVALTALELETDDGDIGMSILDLAFRRLVVRLTMRQEMEL